MSKPRYYRFRVMLDTLQDNTAHEQYMNMFWLEMISRSRFLEHHVRLSCFYCSRKPAAQSIGCIRL